MCVNFVSPFPITGIFLYVRYITGPLDLSSIQSNFVFYSLLQPHLLDHLPLLSLIEHLIFI